MQTQFSIVAAALVVVLAAPALAQTITLVDENYIVTRTSEAPWATAAPVTVAPGDFFDAAQNGNTYLRISGATDVGRFVAFVANEQAHPRITVGEIHPSNATLSFWYRLSNPSAGQAISIGVGLSSGDWDAKPTTGVFASTGDYNGYGTNGIFMGAQCFNLPETGADVWGVGLWRQVTVIFTQFEQTLAPTTELNRIVFLAGPGWAVDPNTVFDIDNVVFTNYVPPPPPLEGDAWYTVWADNYGLPVPPGDRRADLNGDCWITDADYTIWADHYGHTIESPVPEPATMSLLGLGLLGAIRHRRR